MYECLPAANNTLDAPWEVRIPMTNDKNRKFFLTLGLSLAMFSPGKCSFLHISVPRIQLPELAADHSYGAL